MAASAKDQIEERDWMSRSAWAVVAITLIEATTTGRAAEVARALAWFDASVEGDWSAVEAALAPLIERNDLIELLPYL